MKGYRPAMLQAPLSISASLLLTASCALTCALPAIADDTAPGNAKGTPVQGIPMVTRTKAPGATEAPKAADVIDAKAKAIHDRGIDTVKKLKGVEMIAEMKIESVDPSMLPPGLDGKSRVVLDFKNDGGPAPFGRFVLESMKDGKAQMRFAFDGKVAVMIDEPKKCYSETGQQWFQLLGPRVAALPQWYIENRMDMAAMGASPDDMPKMVGATITGEETLDGTPCDVVKIVRSMKLEGMEDDEGKPMPAKEMRITETIAFARTDGLPRRVVSATEIPGEEAMSGMNTTATFSGVKADPTMDEKTFATAAPAGYKKQDMAAEDNQDQGPQMKVKAGDAALDFKLMDLAGKEVTLASLKGKVVLLDFWATWCGPCKQAMPSIQKLSEDYKGKDVVILGVNTWEKKEGAGKKYMTDKGFTYGCLLAGDDLAVAYGISGIPTLIVIGKDGKIEKIEVGFGPEGDKGLRTAIDAGLAK